MIRATTEINTIPFRGGCNTRLEPVLIPPGRYSMVQNIRGTYPGFEKRKGCVKKHTTADGTNKVLSLYQFSKARRLEHHLFAQMSDGDILEATDNPPTVTTGAFGTEVFDGSASQIAGSWSILNDKVIHSNGVDQHHIWAGNVYPVQKFIVYKGAEAIPYLPTKGIDYTNEVTDGLSTTVAILDSLGDLAVDYDAVFVCCPIQAKTITWTVTTANTTAAVMQGHYWKNTSAWTDLSITDNTIASAGKTLGQTGTMTWTAPTDEIPRLMFGTYGFWYRFSLASGDLSATVRASEITFESNFQSIVNLFDGVPVDIVEFQFFDNSQTTYRTFGASSIEIDSAVGSTDIFYFCTGLDLIEGFYVDVGATPNTTASTTINAVSYWDGAAWQAVSGLVDGTTGLSKSGWVTFNRCAAKEQEFNQTQYYGYWWKFTVDQTLNSDVQLAITYQPYFDISELGKGYTNCSWKDRACYSFDRWGQYIYVSAKDAPMTLNGDDYGILEAGDGRSNKVVAMRKFHNELMVWQEERGKEGGCLTLFEGYSPTTFGKLILSSRLGAMNAKAVCVVDGVLTSTATEEKIKTLAFALSRYGVYVTDGRTCSFISEDIANYFDQTNTTNCIRRGYESEMWMEYDSAYNVLRLGLVCGASATVPNVFPVFDLTDKEWSFDSLAQPLSCMTEVEAASGNIPVLQIGGGTADGFVYILNNSTNDVDTAIDSYVTVELDGRGERISLREMILRVKVQSAGNLTVTPYKNSVAQTALTLSQAAENSNEATRRHRINLDLLDQHLALKIQHNTASQSCTIEDLGLRLYTYGGQ